MGLITTIEELEDLYEDVNPNALSKVTTKMTPLYRKWIDSSRFMILSTVGSEGTDSSPRGDDTAIVKIVDERTILLPDWRGNNRLDSLRNIISDGRVSLLFMVAGVNNVIRINGNATISTDTDLVDLFVKGKISPRSVCIITLHEMYFQCAKAIMRSGIWSDCTDKPPVPTAGELTKEVSSDFDAESYDSGYAEYAKSRMW